MSLWRSFFLEHRVYYTLAAIIACFAVGYTYPLFFILARLALFLLIVLGLFDLVLLYQRKNGINAERILADKLSNGDENPITIRIYNNYNFNAGCRIIDEIPYIFQKRDFYIRGLLMAGQGKNFAYTLRPIKRGDYEFGALNIFVTSPLGIVSRRYRIDSPAVAAVYPSIIQMRAFELYAISNRLTEIGIKKIRKIGHTMEFDQIRSYVRGDDYRMINWKATARRSRIMINQYQDERAQQVISVINTGRSMKMPFNEMSLLDYAVNSSLVISNIAMQKQDKAGIITFSHDAVKVLGANQHYSHLNRILEMLHNLTTQFLESDYERMYTMLSHSLKQRSLVLLFTNFESLSAMERCLSIFQRIAHHHFLVVIFFENMELFKLHDRHAENTEAIYKKVVAEKLIYEKRLIVKELQKAGIQSVLVPPQELTVATINKYMELKARSVI